MAEQATSTTGTTSTGDATAATGDTGTTTGDGTTGQTTGTSATTGGSATDTGAATSTGTSTGTSTVDYKDRFEGQQKVNRDLESKLTGARTELDTLRAEVAKLQGKEAEFTAAQEAQRLKDEALAVANQRILKAEFRAAAAGKLNDPADALAYIDLSSFEVSDDGAVDSTAIAAAIADLITTKPYLAAQGGRFQGGADTGTRNESGSTQLTEADVKRLSAEGRHAEIVKAKEEGRLRDYLGS